MILAIACATVVLSPTGYVPAATDVVVMEVDVAGSRP